MFSTIFNFELKRWFKGWTFYVFLILFYVIALFFAAVNFGAFDSFLYKIPLICGIFLF